MAQNPVNLQMLAHQLANLYIYRTNHQQQMMVKGMVLDPTKTRGVNNHPRRQIPEMSKSSPNINQVMEMTMVAMTTKRKKEMATTKMVAAKKENLKRMLKQS